jgi:hypothetical protein
LLAIRDLRRFNFPTRRRASVRNADRMQLGDGF